MTPNDELRLELVRLDGMIAGLLAHRQAMGCYPLDVCWAIEQELSELRCRRVQLAMWMQEGKRNEN